MDNAQSPNEEMYTLLLTEQDLPMNALLAIW